MIPQVDPQKVVDIALEAKNKQKIRHTPLFIAREMAKHDSHKVFVDKLLPEIIQRADELSEFMAIYWKDKKQPISAQVKRGLAKAFTKFDEYALAKYNRQNEIKLRDVLFMCHAKPKDNDQEALWKRLINDELATPDTWEVALSTGKDKRSTWIRLIQEKKIGGLAMLRNLRNMYEVNVPKEIVEQGLSQMNVNKILPMRFIVAAKYAPQYEDAIEKAMFRCIDTTEKLKGKTILIVDVSGSMYHSRISKYTDMDRANAACALAVIVREMCENPVIYATAGYDHSRIHKTALVPSRRGFALSDAIYKMCEPLGSGGIFLKQVMDFVKQKEESADRILVITDEQDCDVSGSPNNADSFGLNNYIINVAANENGIAYKKFVHISGFSEATLEYIKAFESLQH